MKDPDAHRAAQARELKKKDLDRLRTPGADPFRRHVVQSVPGPASPTLCQPPPPKPRKKPRQPRKAPPDPVEEGRKACLRSLHSHRKQVQAELVNLELSLQCANQAIALITGEISAEEAISQARKAETA